ncbi:MAG TPA: hypothetical protein VEN29_22365 [Casimicrobiaceae bacterium]|nr:hypothetical protein [Casimicrobiaceae bacterium]
MNKKLIMLMAASLLPACAYAGKLDLKQDLGGLDLTVAMEPGDSPDAIRITNKTTKVVACTLTYGGASPAPASTVTVQPGKSDTVRVTANASNAPSSGNLKCAEKK